MNAEDVLELGRERRDARAREKSEQDELNRKWHASRLAGFLEPEVWEALGLEPAAAGLARDDGNDVVSADGRFGLDGGEVPIRVSSKATDGATAKAELRVGGKYRISSVVLQAPPEDDAEERRRENTALIGEMLLKYREKRDEEDAKSAKASAEGKVRL